MIRLYANKNNLSLLKNELLTSGSVGVYQTQFSFSDDWDGLTKIVVFRTIGGKIIEAPWKYDDICEIPWEVLTKPKVQLEVGVVGQRGEDIILPTRWVSLGLIKEGADYGEETKPPTPDLWEQKLNNKADNIKYLGDGRLGLFSGDRKLSEDQIYEIGHGLSLVGNKIFVDSVSDFSGDNTLPMTAAGVQLSIGNIEALLNTI